MSRRLPAVRATTVKDCTTVLTLWTPTAALRGSAAHTPSANRGNRAKAMEPLKIPQLESRCRKTLLMTDALLFMVQYFLHFPEGGCI